MKHINALFCLFVLGVFSFIQPISAQSLEGSLPPSYHSALMYANVAETQVARADASFIADATANHDKSGMYVIAQLKDADISPLNQGTWDMLEDGRMIWRVMITGAGAKGLALHFDRFNLPQGGELYVYDRDRTQLLGGYNHKDNTGDNGFAIGMIVGQTVIVEYVAPALLTPGEKKAILNEEIVVPDIHISQVSYIFRGISDLEMTKDIGDSESCEVNINCPEGDDWQVLKRSVVRIYVVEGNSGGWCSGTLINNLASDGTPYILTANHCGPNATAANFNQWTFYFNLEYTSCSGTTQATSHSRTGCTMKAYGSINGGSDFYLLQLNQAPDNSWNPIYAGWRRDNTAATVATGIHHPAGDVKKISSSTTISTGSYSGCASSAHWKIADWRQTTTNLGVTEGGSSGSALFDQNGYLVGTLTGGAASCSYPHNDYYGKLYYHWDQNGSSNDQRAQPWLDPNNTGRNVCPLYDPNNPDDTTGIVDPGTPDDPDTPDDPSVPGDCRKLHYPLHGTLTVYRTPDDGYLAGTNSHHDLAKADYFTKDSTTEYIINIKMNIGQISGNGNVTFCVWSDNNGSPGTILGRQTVSISDILAHCFQEPDPQMPSSYSSLNNRYICNFNTAVPVSGNFFAGVMLPSTGSFALVTNTSNEAANTGWEMKRDSSWVAYDDPSSWGISLTHAFFPQICDVPNATNIEENGNDDIVIYPNPTSENITIRMKDSDMQNRTIQVYDYSGKRIQAEQTISGNEITVHLSHCATGMYLIVIQDGNQTYTRKVSLIK